MHNSLLHLLLKNGDFFNTDISQGSVATHLWCGGVFVYDFVTNFLLSLPVKEFWKSANIWWSYGQELGVLFFWLTVYLIVVYMLLVTLPVVGDNHVCLYVYHRACLGNYVSSLHLIFCTLDSVCTWFSPPLAALWYVMYLQITSCLHLIARNRWREKVHT